jgi:hypothetical protein
MISQCQYTRSHRRGRLTKLWSIYLKACGLSARAFDAVHALAITMSHKWAANAYGELSDRAMKEVRVAIQTSPWHISHDNVNIPLRVFSQRLHNKSHFISGCAATVWVLPPHAELPPDTNRLFQKHHAKTSKEVFNYSDVLYDDTADERTEQKNIHRLLSVLLNHPEFLDYAGRKDPVFAAPPPVDQLPSGPENTVRQYILGTAPIEEASYDGNDRARVEWFKQLHLDSDEEKIRTALERFLVWIGDQLTVERLRGLWKYRHEDYNS